MKTSMEWLSDFLPEPATRGEEQARQAAEALTHGGLPVEVIEHHGDDFVLDVEVTSNRSDCLSHVGVARELAALRDLDFSPAKIEGKIDERGAEAASSAIAVRIDAPELCPQYVARVIRGVRIGPSPAWMARRLEAVGLRAINNVVDVTNYVMFEMGQPLHAFDLAKVKDRQIIVRTARAGETIVSIDGRKRELAPGMLVIADAERPVALAGVMGGADSEVSTTTVDVLLEAARFEPLSIRRTARALAMKSDSSYRFERGIDPTLPQRAAIRAAMLIQQTAGGTISPGDVTAGSSAYQSKQLSLRLKRLQDVLGVELPAEEIVRKFERLGLLPSRRGDAIHVSVPGHRLDISAEIDLVEEAARTLGYERIPTRQEISIRLTPPDPDSTTSDSICRVLTAAGYFEAVTFSFVSDALRSEFGASNLRADSAVRKADATLRPSLLPGLLEAMRVNETNGTSGARLFEIGAVFEAQANGVRERRMVALVSADDLRHVRGVVEALLQRLDRNRAVRVDAAEHAGFARGGCGRVIWGEEPIGFLGLIDKSTMEKLSLRETAAGAELELAALLNGAKHVPQLRELAKFPAVRRDLSLVVAENLAYEKVESLVSDLKLADLEEIDFVTAYRGKPLAAGTKSITITLVFRSATTTLTSEQVEASVQRAIDAAKHKLGATVRQ